MEARIVRLINHELKLLEPFSGMVDAADLDTRLELGHKPVKGSGGSISHCRYALPSVMKSSIPK